MIVWLDQQASRGKHVWQTSQPSCMYDLCSPEDKKIAPLELLMADLINFNIVEAFVS